MSYPPSAEGGVLSTQLFTTQTLETISYPYYYEKPSNPPLYSSKTLETSPFQETLYKVQTVQQKLIFISSLNILLELNY